MSLQRPLKYDPTTGEIARFAADDFINEVDFLTVNNETGAPLIKCTPVYQTATANEVAKAQADAIATARVIALLVDAIADGTSGSALSDGRMSASTAEWDAVTGQTGGLTPGSKYYVSPTTAGMLTTTAPTADGHVVAPVGTAKSTVEFEVSIGTRVVL
ncbi:MAG: hypothetical protein WD005_01325 [Haliea sp.]